MIDLTTTVKCDCGYKFKVVLIKKEDGAYFLSVTDGELKVHQGNPTTNTIIYKFVCDKCLNK